MCSRSVHFDTTPSRSARASARATLSPQPLFAAPPPAGGPAAPAAKSNRQVLDEISALPTPSKGEWRKLASDGAAGVSVFAVLFRESGKSGDISVWLVGTQAEAEHIAQYGGLGFTYKAVTPSLDTAKNEALVAAQKSLNRKLGLKRKRDEAAAAAAALAAAGGAGAGAAAAGEVAALQARLSAALARVHQHAAQLSTANANVAQLQQRTDTLASQLADERRANDTLTAQLADARRGNAALSAELTLHKAALKTVRAACDGVAGNAAGGDDA